MNIASSSKNLPAPQSADEEEELVCGAPARYYENDPELRDEPLYDQGMLDWVIDYAKSVIKPKP